MERLFGRIWKNRVQQERNRPGFLSLEEHRQNLLTFAKLISGSERTNGLHASEWSVGYVGEELFLPAQVSWTADKELNFSLMKLLVLKSMAIRKLQIKLEFHDRLRSAPRLYVLARMGQINELLDQTFPDYENFETKTIGKFKAVLTSHWGTRPQHFENWLRQISSRGTGVIEIGASQKRNDEPPVFLFATVPLPLRDLTGLTVGGTQGDVSRPQTAKATKTRTKSELVLNADESLKTEVNAIMHSFEKLETLDDYDGGRRIESGDDELSSHANALEELELNRMTSLGQTQAIYSAQNMITPGVQDSIENPDSQAISYPEWSERQQKYLVHYCRVFPTQAERGDAGLQLRDDFLKKNRACLESWKKNFLSLVNSPLWQHRQLEGSELDIDACVRLKTELKTYSGQPRIYSAKRTLNMDLAITVLADVSLSTDTWLDGERIVDRIKEMMMGGAVVFQDLAIRVSMAIASSETRARITYCELKKFSEDWNQFFRSVQEIYPRQYTRLGPAIRHATKELEKTGQRHRLLILLTDGKPVDLDPYEGFHGQKDVRKALDEAGNLGVKVLPLICSDLPIGSLVETFDHPRSVRTLEDFFCETLGFVKHETMSGR